MFGQPCLCPEGPDSDLRWLPCRKQSSVLFCRSVNNAVGTENQKGNRTERAPWARLPARSSSLSHCLQCSILSSLFPPRTGKPDSVAKPSSASKALCKGWAVEKTGLERWLKAGAPLALATHIHSGSEDLGQQWGASPIPTHSQPIKRPGLGRAGGPFQRQLKVKRVKDSGCRKQALSPKEETPQDQATVRACHRPLTKAAL